MKKKLKRILLVEDDRATIFLNKFIIGKVDCTENIQVAENGQEALEFLKSGIEDEHLIPNLILLDINMPSINGWEFLEEFKKLEIDKKNKIVIVMLSSSNNPDDKKRAEAIKEVSGFRNKPLTLDKFNTVLEEYFA